MGIHGIPHRVDGDVEGSKSARPRPMIDFVLAPTDMQVAQVQVLGRIAVQTDHRMVLAEVQIKSTY